MLARARSSILPHAVLALALLGVGACKRGRSKPEPGCDQAELAALAKRLDAAAPDARVAIVSEGLLGACEGSLYEPLETMFSSIARPHDDEPSLARGPDPEFVAARERICPDHAKLGDRLESTPVAERARVYAEVCGFDRYELLTAEDLRALGPGTGIFTFVTHDSLITQGTPPEIAKTISRAVLRAEIHYFASPLIQPLRDQTLVSVPVATPPPEGEVVHISTTELVLFERPIVTLEAGALRPADLSGHAIIPFYEDLAEEVDKAKAIMEARGQSWAGLLLIVADARVPSSTLIDVLYTAGRLGFERFAFVVQPTYPILRAILVEPPQFDEQPTPPIVHVLIGEHGYHLTAPDGERSTVAKLDPAGTDASAWNQADLVLAARALVDAEPELRRAVVVAENGISTEVLLATYAALLGPGCDQREPSGCLLPELRIEARAG